MFSKDRKSYILKINNFKSIDLLFDDKVIKSESINDFVIFNENIKDYDQLGYIINKILADVGLEDNILIRYASPDIIFRYKEVNGLEESDLDGYIKYNVQDFLPYSIENIELKAQIINNQILLFGVNREIINFIKNLLLKLEHKNIYFTIFHSEGLSFLFNKKYEDCVLLNIEKDFIEYIIWKNNKVKRYKNFRVLDDKLKDVELLEIKIEKLLEKTIKDINEVVDLNDYKLLLTGDIVQSDMWRYKLKELYGYENQLIKFDINSYFGD